MDTQQLPLLLEADQLETALGGDDLLIVDVSRPQVYAHYHIPGAVHIDYGQIIRLAPPVGGLLPSTNKFSRVASSIGLTPMTHVVCYDDEGGGNASRFLWTLEAFGHSRYSLLNGGLHAWANEEHPLSSDPVYPEPTTFLGVRKAENVAEREYILQNLKSRDLCLLDARSQAEFLGQQRYSKRGGHIPGAVHFEWSDGLDPSRNLRMRDPEELTALLLSKGVSSDKEIVVYCQTHHRSAYSWLMLKALGYPRVKGYHGSWSDWGNCEETPVEVGERS